MGVLAQGTVLADRFEIEELVGHGGMGTVYRALDRAQGQPVALKLLRHDPLDDEQAQRRFARETDVLESLCHSRIVRYVSHGKTLDAQPYLVMQWLEGEDLEAALRRGPLSQADSMRVLQGIAQALAAVHALGVVHRDLKPSNLFLRGRSTADLVLLDFGIARHQNGMSQRQTTTGVILGTPNYMAPEQAQGSSAIQPATDIFAAGCIFYECLTGSPPFKAPHVAGVLARILYETPVPVRELCPAVPEAWAHLLSRMLSKNPAERPRDAAALLHEIAALLPQSTVSLPDRIPSAHAPSPLQEASDQVLVCVVLATFPSKERLDDGAPAPSDTDAVRHAIRRFGFAPELLADGSVLATLLGSDSAADLARLAARCALYLRELWPEARIAIAMGHAPLNGTARIGDAVDRAAHLLERTGEALGDSSTTDSIKLDPVAAGLLDARFVTASRKGGVVLQGDRAELDESRLLLGKPTPCVGRELELGQLEGLMSRALDEGVQQAALVLAPPGLGKSRLRHELLRRVRDKHPEAQILAGFGDLLTAGSPYALVSDALRRHAEIRADEAPSRAQALIAERLCAHVDAANRPRISAFLGELCGVSFPAAQSPLLKAARSDPSVMSEQITLAFLDWLAAECAAHPVVLVLDDVQWGDALTAKLVDRAVRDLEDTSLLVLALGRREVTELFPGFLSDIGSSLSLRPLGKRASEELIKSVLGDAVSPEAVARIVRLAAGNALFLEELIRAEAEGKTGDVPETVLAMLQARLSRLPAEARKVLRAASVFGETFWHGGVRQVCERWGGVENIDGWLGQLVEIELVKGQRQSRFLSETEYAFRHALVRDASHGLLTEADQRSGHLAASYWLEIMGEADAMVLAGHAQAGGDMARAVGFYTLAAEQSLRRGDNAEALARADKGIACGAEGEALGTLWSLQTSALRAQGSFARCVEVGLAALDVLPPGSLWWCRTAEKLIHALPMAGETRRHEELAAAILRTEPAPEARTVYLSVLCHLLYGFGFSGARDDARRCLDIIDRIGSSLFAQDACARGLASLWRGVYVFMAEPDIYAAYSLTEQGARDFTESHEMHHLGLAWGYVAGALVTIGDFAGAEAAARKGLAITEQLKDSYVASFSLIGLSRALCEPIKPERLDEAEQCARSLLEAHISPVADAVARWLLARVAIARGEWARAEAECQKAEEPLVGLWPFWFLIATDLIRALMGQGRLEQAAVVARKGQRMLSQMGGTGFGEIPFRVAAAEALFEASDREAAESALREALCQIDLRAAKIADARLRDCFLYGREENVRAFELGRAWFGDAEITRLTPS